MAPKELKGKNLGEKHKHFNTLVKDTLSTSDETTLEIFNQDDGDVENLIKIDVASKKRNLDYILKVLVCDDLLYVSRAIKQCEWLVTEAEYSYIINPNYLYSTFLPLMCTKAANKLIKSIQFNLKDESRVELFYEHEANPAKAIYWLPNCSLAFIERNIVNHINHIKISQLKRLCEKSISLLQIYLDKCQPYENVKALTATSFLLNTETEKYLDLTEQYLNRRHLKFSPNTTKLILEKDSKRITNNFIKFCNLIHLPTFIKFLKKDDIKDFLLNQAIKAEEQKINHLFDSKTVKSFISAIPEKDRFEFVKDLFIDKIFQNETSRLRNDEKRAFNYLFASVNLRCEPSYIWYQYAPFDIAFDNIKKIMKPETSDRDKNSMLALLLGCAKQNETHICRILQYFKDKHLYSQANVRNEFFNKFISEVHFYSLSSNTWNILEDLIQKDYDDTNEIAQTLLQAIIIYKVIHLDTVPIAFEKLFTFNTLNIYKNKFNVKERELVFTYLYKLIIAKIQNKASIKVEDLGESVANLDSAFKLLREWDKDLKDYPFLLEEVQQLVKLVNQNSSNTDMSSLYNTKKSWKKYLFEESLHLNLNEYTLINAIKHDQSLLKRSSYIGAIKIINLKPITNFLKKIRIYYSSSLASDISKTYCEELYNTSNHMKITRGISLLFSRNEMLKILDKYAPKTSKIIDSDVDMETLSLQRHLAKNMHLARPQPLPETVLQYAKGDYLQYALPSVLAIFYNLNILKSRIFIPKLLDSQVSLQKHGIRLGFIKLQSNELTNALSDIWKTTKNSTIRCVLFKGVFKQLCKKKDTLHRKDIWSLLEMLIDHLTLEENKAIYDLLFKVDSIPLEVRSAYYMKAYPLLKKLSDSDSDSYSYTLYITFIPCALEIIGDLESQFIANLLLEYINIEYNKKSNESYWTYTIIPLISSYLLYAKDTDTQMKKYEEIFLPILKITTSNSESVESTSKLCKKDLRLLLKQLRQDVPNFVTKDSIICPTKMFAAILKELEKLLVLSENYILITQWKLTVALIDIMETQKPINNWNDTCFKMAEEYGKICCLYLKEHTEEHFSYIYTLFSNALQSTLEGLLQQNAQLEVCKALLLNQNFVEAYLVALQLIPKHQFPELSLNIKSKELRDTIIQHPSLEVKIHYYDKFRDVKEDVNIIGLIRPPPVMLRSSNNTVRVIDQPQIAIV